MYRAAYDVKFSGSENIERIYYPIFKNNKSKAQKIANKYLGLLSNLKSIEGIPKLINVEKYPGNSATIEDVVEFPIS